MWWVVGIGGIIFVVVTLIAATGGFEVSDEQDHKRSITNLADWFL